VESAPASEVGTLGRWSRLGRTDVVRDGVGDERHGELGAVVHANGEQIRRGASQHHTWLGPEGIASITDHATREAHVEQTVGIEVSDLPAPYPHGSAGGWTIEIDDDRTIRWKRPDGTLWREHHSPNRRCPAARSPSA
jgi:hypothetical protein